MHFDALVSRLPLRCAAAIAFTCCALACHPAARAEPPRIGEANPLSGAFASLDPTQWNMPEVRMPKFSVPGFGSQERVIRRKPAGVFDGFSRSMSRGWTRTKSFLDPSKLWPEPNPSPRDSEEGFWASLFSEGGEPQKIETVNDFLRQPHPY